MSSNSVTHRHPIHLIVVVTAGLLALAACGSGAPSTTPQSSTSAPSTTATTPAPTATQTSPTASATVTPSQQTLSAYFFGTLAKGRLTPTARPAGSVAVLADSMRALLVGPNQSERAIGITTQLPPGIDVHEIELEHEVATIELRSAGTATVGISNAALAQVVFTATQFPTVRAVKVDVDGHHAVAPHRSAPAASQGDDRLLTRADFEDWSPAVLVESPLLGTTIHSPVRVHGTANTFEAMLRIEITDWDGRIVASQVVMATSGTGTRGTFDVTIPYTTQQSGSGEIITSVDSPKDGSRILVSETPVTVAP